MSVLPNFEKISQVLPYVAQYSKEGLMSLEMGYNCLTDGHVSQFMSMYAPELAVLTNCVFVWLKIMWHTMTKIVIHAVICPKDVYYGLLWWVMIKNYQLWSRILRISTSTTVSLVLKNSVKKFVRVGHTVPSMGWMWTNEAPKSSVSN